MLRGAIVTDIAEDLTVYDRPKAGGTGRVVLSEDMLAVLVQRKTVKHFKFFSNRLLILTP